MTGTDGGVNISQTIVTPDNGVGDRSPDGDAPGDRYYIPAEYHELSKSAKTALYKKRQKRNRGGDYEKSRRNPTRKYYHQELKRVIKDLTQQLVKQGSPEEQDLDLSS